MILYKKGSFFIHLFILIQPCLYPTSGRTWQGIRGPLMVLCWLTWGVPRFWGNGRELSNLCPSWVPILLSLLHGGPPFYTSEKQQQRASVISFHQEWQGWYSEMGRFNFLLWTRIIHPSSNFTQKIFALSLGDCIRSQKLGHQLRSNPCGLFIGYSSWVFMGVGSRSLVRFDDKLFPFSSITLE